MSPFPFNPSPKTTMNDTPTKTPALYATDFATVRTGRRTSLVIRRTGIGIGRMIGNRTIVSMPFEVLGTITPDLDAVIVIALTGEAAELELPPTLRLLLIEWREARDKFPDDAFRPKSLSRFMIPSLAEAELAKRNANSPTP